MPPKKKTAKKQINLTFEEAVAELDLITEKLEGEPSSLTNLLDDFERGQELLNFCQSTLKSARKRLDLIEANLHAEPVNSSTEETEDLSSTDDDDVRLF